MTLLCSLIIHKHAKIRDKSSTRFKDSTAAHWQLCSQAVGQGVFLDKLHVSKASACTALRMPQKQQEVTWHLEVGINTELKVIFRCRKVAEAAVLLKNGEWDEWEKKSWNIQSWKRSRRIQVQPLGLHRHPNNPTLSIPGSSVQTLLELWLCPFPGSLDSAQHPLEEESFPKIQPKPFPDTAPAVSLGHREQRLELPLGRSCRSG